MDSFNPRKEVNFLTATRENNHKKQGLSETSSCAHKISFNPISRKLFAENIF